MQMGSVHMGTMKGKLKGTIDATTPIASRTSLQYTPVLTLHVHGAHNREKRKRHLLLDATLRDLRQRARPLDGLQTLVDAAERFSLVLAVFEHNQVRQLLAILEAQLAELVNILHAAKNA